MRTLPFDCHRCKPNIPGDKCHECLRWADLPGQTYGPRTAVVFVIGPGETGCSFIEKYPEKDKCFIQDTAST